MIHYMKTTIRYKCKYNKYYHNLASDYNTIIQEINFKHLKIVACIPIILL
jgi:hypothetical protein